MRRTRSDIENNLRAFRVEPMIDEQRAIRAARKYRLLRARGVTIRKTVDVIIATFCLDRNARPASRRSEFEAFADILELAGDFNLLSRMGRGARGEGRLTP